MAHAEPRRRILIGFAEAVAGPETAFSLLDAGYEVIAFTRAGTSAALRRCPEVRICEITSPAEDIAGAVRDLEALVQDTQPSVVLPLDDGALLVCSRTDDDVRRRVAGPTGPSAQLSMEKRLQVQAADRAGFAVPASRWLDDAHELLEGDRPEFPFLIRPATAVEDSHGRIVGGPVKMCADLDELRSAVGAYRRDQRVLVQPLVRGRGELVSGLARAGELLVCSAHRRVRTISGKGSTSACTPTALDAGVEAATRNMLAEAAWDGLFQVELMRDLDGLPWFIELNGRSWGAMALSRRMGYEYPAWAVQLKLDPSFTPAPPSPREAIVCRHLGREILHLLSALRGPDSAALDAQSRLRAVRRVLRVSRRDRWYNLRAGCHRLFVYDTVQTVRSALGSKSKSLARAR